MITINIDKKVEDKFKGIYQKGRFSDSRSTSDTKISLVQRLQKKIVAYLSIPNPQNAELIVMRFLQAHFGNDPNNVTEDKITAYFLRKDLKTIIHLFWECVSLIWSEKLTNEGTLPMPSDKYADALSAWETIKDVALCENNKDKRIALVTQIITPETLPFFEGISVDDLRSTAKQGTVLTNRDYFKKVKLRFDSELYTEETGALAILKSLFDYDLLNGAPRHEVLIAMEIPVCPYCNRQYITSFADDEFEKTTADLDHYYCQSLYPYLALSLYNFVPSCQICNSRFKLAKDFYHVPHLYPYEKVPSSTVTFKLGDVTLLLDDATSEDAILDIICSDEAAANSVSTFRLNEVYQSHRDYVQELVWKTKIYNDDLISMLQNEFDSLFGSTQDVRQLIFGQYLDEIDIHKRPLAKLTQDLLVDLGFTE